MAFQKLFFFFLITQYILIQNAVSQTDYYCYYNEIGNYTNGSTYQTNLNTLFSSLFSDTKPETGFYNFTIGQQPDTVYATALCQGDLKVNECQNCVNSAYRVLQDCPNSKQAWKYFDKCMFRYSNQSIIGSMEIAPEFVLSSTINMLELDVFNKELGTLLIELRKKTSSGSSVLKYAVGTVNVSSQTIYALEQCSPDLSAGQCDDCLRTAIGKFPNCCAGKEGGRVGLPSCNVRYEIYSFYGNTTADAPPQVSTPPPPPPSEKESNTVRIVILIVVPIVSVTVLIICVWIYFRARRSRRNNVDERIEASSVHDISTVESLHYDFSSVQTATDNFSDANKLGQGGFGAVYKGRLPNGVQIAVKRLSMNSGQGDLEFKNEVLLVAKLQHRNLVRLLGFSLEGRERLLIYEFVENASLDKFIFDPVEPKFLGWEARFKIIGGIARGLLYLHEDSRLRIIHRDLKASNILLDADMNPKIADFGMARLFVLDETRGNTSRIVGTYGYMAPEYALHGHFSVKSDVYSLGVLVLEIVTGEKSSSFWHQENAPDLISHTWKNWKEGTVSNIIDSTLKDGSRNEMRRCIHIGLLCVQDKVADRPTMASVYLMLNTHSLTLPLPSQPAFFANTDVESDISSSKRLIR